MRPKGADWARMPDYLASLGRPSSARDASVADVSWFCRGLPAARGPIIELHGILRTATGVSDGRVCGGRHDDDHFDEAAALIGAAALAVTLGLGAAAGLAWRQERVPVQGGRRPRRAGNVARVCGARCRP